MSVRPGARHRGAWAAVAGIVALVAVQQLARFGSGDLLTETVTNAAHVPMFALLTVLLRRALGAPRWPLLLAVVVALALATEAAQMPTGRSASLMDVALDLLGALPTIAALELCGRFAAAGRRRAAARVRAGLVVLVAVLFAAAPVRVLLAYHARDTAFPVLLRPDDWRLAPLVAADGPTRLMAAPPDWPGYAGERVLAVTWSRERYPGIRLNEVCPDWGGHRQLAVDVYLPEGPAMSLTAAVGHAGRPGTAAFQRRTVAPGPQRLRFDLDVLLATGGDRPPRVTRLILHTSSVHAGRRLLIGRVELVGDALHAAPNPGTLAPSH